MRLRLASLGRGQARRPDVPAVVPADPRTVVGGPLDPDLSAILSGLRPHRRRLWLRRIVRRLWLVAGAVAVLEAALFAIARFFPIEIVPALAVALPVLGEIGRAHV